MRTGGFSILVVLAMSGCLAASHSPASDQDPGHSNVSLSPPPDPSRVMIAYDGTTYAGECVGTLAGGPPCVWTSGDYLHPLPNVTRNSSLNATVTWTDEQTTVMTMEIQLAYKSEAGGWGSSSDAPHASGHSPLNFQWDLSNYANRSIGIAAFYIYTVDSPVAFEGTYKAQPFHVAASIGPS